MKAIQHLVKSAGLLALICLCSYCARNPYASSNKVYRQQAKAYAKTLQQQPGNIAGTGGVLPPWWVGTVNFNMRKPNMVIIHHTAQDSCAQTLKTFTMQPTQVSAHYVICRDGMIHHMLNDYLRAWHGGVAKWGGVTDINSSSIGIELDNNGLEPFAPAQINSLLILLDTLKLRYNIPAANFVGHGDIAPGRKVDPSAWFPWQQLAGKGFGLWYTDTTNTVVPSPFNQLQALRIIGYDIKDSTAALKAFKRHFMPQDSLPGMTESGRKILFNVMQRYQ
ncbi:N-acetylmuramoyl-L-alanine amidase [Chitinophaga nivalis]|uniref:N-acetylmuramoyl-L-alanine amidase n=1 Tax=Chitinophaga nivalis TaxID=2991709 RepID=A0ABT3IEB2_9BACT|nr:N-acetylmuramoyl-L-alanine amidase [Chitinophaga nivalis]MCW3468013.1 N-acetylmuramoyl-L-alanine amidase [Chitinophaga nivalis]MCW3482296.1 N-acetylmuramoyl-L-alanine amidase [Chitinophaga nivalis]